ncbi:DUF6115 domain-containing protein [Acetohalobium arabaticum]|uniref:Uncharacterized protein n=1 Tax=Acetohalobium arabaticum (strain ATCC 49924 / DSM 5501 / Z-7288) TaxID=574087 RepID=D9QRH9_ACEAZ|nr:hypothetical protein [Acetohalobium arabaticum]ADL13120.1 hypothetical protein Acear_1614 [Acetohalobium arabaticum DSM 5501]
MLKILILSLGISCIAASLFLAYRQEKKVGHELRKREVRLNRLLQQVNNLLDRLEKQYSTLEEEQKSDFVDTLDFKLKEDYHPDKKVESINQNLNKEDRKREDAAKTEKHKQINELLNSGFNYSEIAQHLNMGRREVELIHKLND